MSRYIFFFALLAGLWAPLHAAPKADVIVLCYHTFRNLPNDPYDVSLTDFAHQLDELAKLGYRFVTADDLDGGKVTGTRNILITIDDGNRSVIDAFEKVLRPRGIRPILFIYAHIIGKKDYALTWEELARLAKEGCTIGAHGYFHDPLSEGSRQNDPLHFVQEVEKTPLLLKENIGPGATIFFSYPFGVTSAPAQEALLAAGYRYAFTLINRPIPVPVPEKERLLLPRYMVTHESWPQVHEQLKLHAAE